MSQGVQLERFRAGSDNFNYLLFCPKTKRAIALDPRDGALMAEKVRKRQLTLSWIVNTHGHWDHVEGNRALVEEFGCKVAAYQTEKIDGVDHLLRDGEMLTLDDIEMRIHFTPGHTAGHITLEVNNTYLFTGDTLFLAGCGNCRMGGNPDHLGESLKKLGGFPDHLEVHGGHDYHQKNIAFCREIEPENDAVRDIEARVVKNPDVVSTLGMEKSYNVFLRSAAGIRAYPNLGREPREVFRVLRAMKDRF